ncbi:MAG: hypothetical protein JNJ88_07760 [Planctomycetes bacterium]|nr:hypothetical protein [Planctomycetota bacterium]
MKLEVPASQIRALRDSSLAYVGCVLRPKLPGIFFRRLVPIHLDRRHELVKRFGTELVHLLVDAKPVASGVQWQVLGATSDASIDGGQPRATLSEPLELDLDARVALVTRLKRIFGVTPPAPFERYPSTWEALVTVLLGGKSEQGSRMGASVLGHRNALARTFGTTVWFEEEEFGALPDPLGLAPRPVEELEQAGLPLQSARRLVAVAQQVASQQLNLGALFGKSEDEVAAILEPIDGLTGKSASFVCRLGAACALPESASTPARVGRPKPAARASAVRRKGPSAPRPKGKGSPRTRRRKRL